uniref:Lipocalin n=1 Tax=Rhipicephalus zambeziensis TaxID=60191 RepID=A0A224YEJ6_9ACAR
MSLLGNWLLCLSLSVMLQYPAKARTKSHEYQYPAILSRMPSPYDFMTSQDIYLYLSSMKYPNVSCIRAIPLKKDDSARTLTQEVDVRIEYNDDVDWWITNASYTPIERTHQGHVSTFSSIDEVTGAATNYTFLLTTRHCAVVSKSKIISSTASYVSKELWVKNPFSAKGIIPCYQQFMEVCNCNRHPAWYSTIQCKHSEVQ